MSKITVTDLTVVTADDGPELPSLVGICRGPYEENDDQVGWGEDLNEAMTDLIELEQK